jgi:pimeloyl-ACP methyl ester carboxylesterase
MERLAVIREVYGAPHLVSDPDAYFVPPPAIEPRVAHVRTTPWGAKCLDVTWESAFEPFGAAVRDAYLANARNHTAAARLFVGGGPRPAVILAHGYRSGYWVVEERAWPIRWLNRQGFDVAIAVLPHHGVRARPEGGAPPFPGADPRFTNEGFRQAVSDLRVLLALLEARGATSVGMMGMSLGGYTTSLMATLEARLAFAVPLIPLASLADFARDQGNLGSGDQVRLQHAALEAANHVVSPFARPARLPPARVLVVGAEGDRVTPIAHAERLAAHFGTPLLRVGGGHLVQTWKREAFHAARAMLRREGIL